MNRAASCLCFASLNGLVGYIGQDMGGFMHPHSVKSHSLRMDYVGLVSICFHWSGIEKKISISYRQISLVCVS